MIEPHLEPGPHPSVKVREPARKICEYLLAAGVCDEAAVNNGLERQENLRSKGYDSLIGMLLIDPFLPTTGLGLGGDCLKFLKSVLNHG